MVPSLYFVQQYTESIYIYQTITVCVYNININLKLKEKFFHTNRHKDDQQSEH